MLANVNTLVSMLCLLCLGSSQIVSGSNTHPVAYGIQQPGYIPLVPPPPSSVIPLSSFCSAAPNSSAVIPGVVAYPNQLVTPVNQLPPYTQVPPPPTLQWLDTSRQACVPPNTCMRILHGGNVPKVDFTNSVILPSAKPNWPASDKKSKVILIFIFLTFH